MKQNYDLDLSAEKAFKQPYDAPSMEAFGQLSPLSILEIVSLEGEIYDFEDGDDF